MVYRKKCDDCGGWLVSKGPRFVHSTTQLEKCTVKKVVKAVTKIIKKVT